MLVFDFAGAVGALMLIASNEYGQREPRRTVLTPKDDRRA
jgi:hypothetical protein